MRLTPDEIAAVTGAARAAFGTDAVVRVFGSRADDAARGGDLDLMIEAAPGRTGPERKAAFLDAVERPLDGLKVDLLVRERGAPATPIEAIALRDGVIL